MTVIQGRITKKFQFVLLFEGIPTLTMQKVTPPDVEINEIIHSVGLYNQKSPGKMKVGDLTCEKIMSVLDPNDDWIWKWFGRVQNFQGTALDPNFAKSGELRLLDADMVTISRAWALDYVWPKKIPGVELDSLSDENIIEQVVFSVSRYEPI